MVLFRTGRQGDSQVDLAKIKILKYVRMPACRPAARVSGQFVAIMSGGLALAKQP
jgi:hypothetical protein